MFNTEDELILMASALYRILEQRRWMDATPLEQANYIAVCRQTVESVKFEQQQQPVGQKDVA